MRSWSSPIHSSRKSRNAASCFSETPPIKASALGSNSSRPRRIFGASILCPRIGPRRLLTVTRLRLYSRASFLRPRHTFSGARSFLRILNLLLNLLSEFQWMRHRVKRFRRASRTTDNHRSKAEHSARYAFLYADALHFGKKNFERPPGGYSDLHDHAPVSHSHFRRVPFHESNNKRDEADNEQNRSAHQHGISTAIVERDGHRAR